MKSKYIIAVISGLFLLSSCEQEKPKFQISEVGYSPIYAKASPDSLQPPIITQVKGNNALIKISGVTKETIPLKHPNGVGVPTVTSYGVKDGLPSNMVQDLVVGQDGMLWIGGIGNLSSFDGSAFVNYGSTLGAGDLFVSQLLVDTKGQLWVGCFNELFKFDGINLQPVILGSDNEDLYLWCLIEDNDGAIWAGTDHGLFRIIGDSISNFRIDGHEEERIFKLILNKDGNITVCTSNGLFQFDGAKFNPLYFLGKEFTPGFWEVFLDSQENYWFSLFENGKYKIGKFDGKDFTPIIEDASLYGRAFEDSSGKIWLPTSENIYVYDGVNLVQYSYDELGVDQFFSIVEDDTGNIWAGGLNGLHKISMGYMNLLEIQGTPSNFNSALTIDDQGVKWISSSGHQLIRYALNEIVIYDLSEYLAQEKGFIYEIYADKSGNIWMTTGGPPNQPREVIKFDGKEFYWYDPSKGLNLTFTQQIDEDLAGTLYFSGSGGLTTFDGEAFTHYGASQGFPESTGKVLSTSDGKLWVGTDTSGVFCFWEDSLIKIDTKNGLPANFINSIAEGPEGNIWIGTDGGLSKFDGKELKNYTEADGLSNLVSTIAVDHDRKLIWFLTVTGLAILPFDQINESKPNFTVYSQRNGFEMISGSFTRSKIFFDSSGVWAQGLGLIYRLDHDKVQNFPSPVLKIKNIRIDNQEVLWSLISDNPSEDSLTVMNESVLKLGKRINENNVESQFSSFGKISYDRLQNENLIPLSLSLPYFNNDITFEFTAISPSFGKHTRFRYKLDGYDKNWSPYSTKNEAHFGNMSEGSYTFNLEAISAYGSEGNLSYTFVVRPPWWRTWWAYAFYIILLLLLARRVHLLQKAKTLRKERERLQVKELAQAKEIEKAYTELKSTQAQLIQSEKMASLGELTAGIAHEIQNPLNFVNNFSELNSELLDELKEELANGNVSEVEAIASDLSENEAKITHHGKRADAIVKGMLAHSRSGKGEKKPTDLNKLAEEYLKLSYHGLRAKDKSFNADFKTDFDPNLPKVNVVPQDIGRVLLNLINNAFQAVNERSKREDPEYKPTVTVKTELTANGQQLIAISDNGPGIPPDIKDKIFQPFFTTKPTGQGTGLGLSLSYDIVKAHGGQIHLESTEDQGSVFNINLPTTE